MSIGGTRTAPSEAVDDVMTQVEVEVRGRSDALTLCETLVRFHSFLVQLTSDRWVVHARAPGWGGEPLVDVLRAIDEWQGERHGDPLVHIDLSPQRRPRSSASRPRRAAAPAARCRPEEP
jgi:hypothetical protein